MAQISPEARLALIMSRQHLTATHVRQVADIVKAGIDWQRLHAVAAHNNVIPLLAANLSVHVPGVPQHIFDRFVRDRQRIRLRAMLLFTQLLFVVKAILMPRGIRFALVKGIALARRHYGDPFARHCQDIDILVQPERVWEVAEILIGHGWAVANPAWSGQPIKSFARYVNVMEMVSPEGLRIELHRMLDNSGLLFDSTSLLDHAEPLDFFGSRFPALNAVDEFVYVCLHHSRHAWSCLHWCADLPAMTAAPGFEANVLKTALRFPLMEKTVTACMLLAANLEAIAEGTGPSQIEQRSPLLDPCLQGIDRTHKPVDVGTDDASEMEPDFPFWWQRTGSYRWRFALSRCRPNLNDFNALPVADGFQWVYWFTRPWRALLRRLDVG